MGVPDSAVFDFIAKVRSWIDWGKSDQSFSSCGFEMAGKDCRICRECRLNCVGSCLMYECETCARVLCENCVRYYGSVDVVISDDHNSKMESVISIQCCQFCNGLSTQKKGLRNNCDKVHPADSPRQCDEPESPASGAEKLDGYSPHAVSKSSVASFSSHPSMFSFRGSPNRSDEEEEEN